MSSLCCAGDRTQDFVHTCHAFYQRGYCPLLIPIKCIVFMLCLSLGFSMEKVPYKQGLRSLSRGSSWPGRVSKLVTHRGVSDSLSPRHLWSREVQVWPPLPDIQGTWCQVVNNLQNNSSWQTVGWGAQLLCSVLPPPGL